MSPTLKKIDYLIVGQGIAGSMLAMSLLDKEKTVVVIDDGFKTSSSWVAGGIVNPITGRRLVRTWRFEECWEKMLEEYSHLEKILNQKYFFQKNMVRFLKSKEEREVFNKKLHTGEFEGLIYDHGEGALKNINGLELADPWFRVSKSGFLDQAGLLQGIHHHLERLGSLVLEKFNEKDLVLEDSSVRWKNYEASKIILCQGYIACESKWFKDLPFRNVKGEILTLQAGKHFTDEILNRGKWLLPYGSQMFRAGASYDLNTIDTKITENAREEVLGEIAKFGDWELEVVLQEAGVRPAVHDFKPVLGLHPWHPQIGIINGLGSKGSLMAPLMAKEMCDFLIDGIELKKELSIDRFQKYL